MRGLMAEFPTILLEAADEFAAACSQFHVRYALIGALASGYRSRPRSTRDADFLLTVPQLTLPPLLEELQRRGFEFEMTDAIRAWSRDHMFVMAYHGSRVDLLKPPLAAYSHVLDRATEEPWLHNPIRIATAEGVILLKLIAFRLQDQADIESVIASNRETLDVEWIRNEWKTFADLDDPRMRRLMEWMDPTTS